MQSVCERIENIVEKGEKCWLPVFFLFKRGPAFSPFLTVFHKDLPESPQNLEMFDKGMARFPSMKTTFHDP